MTKAENAILDSGTPEAYIEASLKAKISPAAKARLARLWMERTGYSKEDILRARNRHPYWKKKKMEGSADRTRKRLSAHDYSGGGALDWTRELIEEFLDLNGTDAEGRYLNRDWELAQRFHSSIPSIQYMRRKYRRVIDMLGPKASRAKLLDYLSRAESVLVRGPEAVEALKASEKLSQAEAKVAAAVAARYAQGLSAKPKKAASGKAAVKKGAPKKGSAAALPAKKAVAKAEKKPGKPATAKKVATLKKSAAPAPKKTAALKKAAASAPKKAAPNKVAKPAPASKKAPAKR